MCCERDNNKSVRLRTCCCAGRWLQWDYLNDPERLDFVCSWYLSCLMIVVFGSEFLSGASVVYFRSFWRFLSLFVYFLLCQLVAAWWRRPWSILLEGRPENWISFSADHKSRNIRSSKLCQTRKFCCNRPIKARVNIHVATQNQTSFHQNKETSAECGIDLDRDTLRKTVTYKKTAECQFSLCSTHPLREKLDTTLNC